VAQAVKQGVDEAGGVRLNLPVVSLGAAPGSCCRTHGRGVVNLPAVVVPGAPMLNGPSAAVHWDAEPTCGG
jgi:dihydroxyacid dehydratase/phosphogluconate dehydratase